ncbi:hypothetical protein BVI2075_670034 [Burkholderia vietnamiensis]|nr:hypothetical protein BVI2075_670034 [Burkholderia vietnamiensis]
MDQRHQAERTVSREAADGVAARLPRDAGQHDRRAVDRRAAVGSHRVRHARVRRHEGCARRGDRAGRPDRRRADGLPEGARREARQLLLRRRVHQRDGVDAVRPPDVGFAVHQPRLRRGVGDSADRAVVAAVPAVAAPLSGARGAVRVGPDVRHRACGRAARARRIPAAHRARQAAHGDGAEPRRREVLRVSDADHRRSVSARPRRDLLHARDERRPACARQPRVRDADELPGHRARGQGELRRALRDAAVPRRHDRRRRVASMVEPAQLLLFRRVLAGLSARAQRQPRARSRLLLSGQRRAEGRGCAAARAAYARRRLGRLHAASARDPAPLHVGEPGAGRRIRRAVRESDRRDARVTGNAIPGFRSEPIAGDAIKKETVETGRFDGLKARKSTAPRGKSVRNNFIG